MQRMIIAGLFAAAMMLVAPTAADAHRRGFVPRRVVNSYQRDVRKFQRQSSRSFNQINRDFSRSIRRSPRNFGNFGFAPRSSGLYLGGSRGGVFIRF